jgi:hypothetical protein
MSENSPPSDLLPMELPSMSSAEGSPARTSARRERVLALKASALASGLKSLDLLASYDRSSSSWRTSQRCLVEGWTVFSATWPRSGLMLSGIAYQLPPLAPRTDETASGLWPTPDTLAGRPHEGNVRLLRARILAGDMTEVEAKAMLHGKSPFDAQGKIPAMWPTPNAGDYKAGMSNAPGRQQSSLPRSVGIVEGVSSGRRGGLNPNWVEWLMGFPIKWTALEH